MYYRHVTTSCPKCKKALCFKITRVMGVIRVTSGLGPNFVVCSSCNTKMITNYKEWPQLSTTEKIWYALLSVFYGVILGGFSSMTFRITAANATELAGLIVFMLIGVVVFLVQMMRIQTSLERTESNGGSQKTVSFWDWETNLQFYGMCWFALMLGTIFIVRP